MGKCKYLLQERRIDGNYICSLHQERKGKDCSICINCKEYCCYGTEEKPTYEMVKHPQHYNKEGIPECWDIFEEVDPKLCAFWCMETAYKYRYRAGAKPGEADERDINKFKNYRNKAYCLADLHLFRDEICDFENKLMAKFKYYGLISDQLPS